MNIFCNLMDAMSINYVPPFKRFETGDREQGYIALGPHAIWAAVYDTSTGRTNGIQQFVGGKEGEEEFHPRQIEETFRYAMLHSLAVIATGGRTRPHLHELTSNSEASGIFHYAAQQDLLGYSPFYWIPAGRCTLENIVISEFVYIVTHGEIPKRSIICSMDFKRERVLEAGHELGIDHIEFHAVPNTSVVEDTNISHIPEPLHRRSRLNDYGGKRNGLWRQMPNVEGLRISRMGETRPEGFEFDPDWYYTLLARALDLKLRRTGDPGMVTTALERFRTVELLDDLQPHHLWQLVAREIQEHYHIFVKPHRAEQAVAA